MNTVIDKPTLALSTLNEIGSRLSDRPSEHSHLNRYLAQEIIERSPDGILIVNEHSRVIYANTHAYQLCRPLLHPASLSLDTVPAAIWHLCEALIDSRQILPDHLVVIDDEIQTTTTLLRVRARWMELPTTDSAYIAVTLEDRCQSLHHSLMMEARKYQLTKRETEVWQLRSANLPYKEIAARLHITVNTVKKHVKSINAKRDAFHWGCDSA